MESKSEKMNRVCFTVIKHELRKGHLLWKIAPLAREAKVSRGWLYSYLGSDKKEILLAALNHTIDEYLYMSPAGIKFLKEKGPVAAFERTQKFIAQYPEVNIFYFKYARLPGEIGDIIRKREKDYADHLSSRYGLTNDFQASFLRSLINGISLSFFHSPQLVKDLATFMLSESFVSWLKTQDKSG